MKALRSGILMATFLVLFAGTAFAIPSLQLNIAGGSYDLSTETIVAPAGNSFDLYAYLIPNKSNMVEDIYYVSVALMPQSGPLGVDLGSFTFNGTPVSVTSGMEYGTPPIETIATQLFDPGDLSKHSIFDTYFAEFAFEFDFNQVTPFNTQDLAGSTGTAGTGMYYKKFTLDLTGLDAGYGLHFDLYNVKLKAGGDVDVNNFAPFSHDAQSDGRVPEAGALLLFGTGLVGLVGYRRVRRMQ